MTFDALRPWFEFGHLASLATLVLIALAAAAFGARQLSGFQALELLRYLGSEDYADRQAIVLREIRPLSGSKWWLDANNERLVAVASEVAALYDALYAVTRRADDDTRALIYSNWADAIVASHSTLASYLDERRREPKSSSLHRGFSALAAAVRSYAVEVPRNHPT